MEIYLYAGCTSCKKADKALHESGKPYLRRDYFRDRFTVDELRSLLQRAGLGVAEVLSTRSRAYAELQLAGKTLSDGELLELMVDEPTLLRRPLIIGGGTTLVGFNAGAVEALIQRA